MSKSFAELLLIITMLTTAVGQVMANDFVAFNDNVAEEQNQQQRLALAVVNDADSNSATDDDCCEIECCESECFCPSNTCTSVVYLDFPIHLIELVRISEPSLSLLSQRKRFFSPPVYRPPISPLRA